MTLNGAEYLSSLGKPVGDYQEEEAGFSTEYRCSIVFPLRLPGAVKRPGLAIVVDPKRITPGPEVLFGAGAGESGISVDYYPRSGHQMQSMTMLVFSSGRSGGGGTIRFDEMDARVGGRVRGKLLQATLCGCFENAESAQITEPDEPRILKLRNFPFDVVLDRSMF